MRTKLSFTVISLGIFLAVAGAVAAPQRSQNPRVGQLAELTFDRGSAALPSTGRDATLFQIGKAASWAMQNPDGLLVVDGHASREGDRAANVRLSMARAETVRDQLIAAGVDPEQIVIAGYGEARAKRSAVIWGTRAGMNAIVTKARSRGEAVSFVSEAEPRPTAKRL